MAQLSEARDQARRVAGKEAVVIHVAPGTYYLPEPLRLEARDSGSKSFPVIYRAEQEGKAVLSGGQLLSLKWQSIGNGRFRASVPDVGQIDQLFVNGERQRMARYPNYDANKKTAA
ncbi:MAG: signaling protein, partial [Verrucomicrobia bacterium]